MGGAKSTHMGTAVITLLFKITIQMSNFTVLIKSIASYIIVLIIALSVVVVLLMLCLW